MNIGILFALCAMIGFGLSSSFGKATTKYINSTESIMYRNLGTVLLLIPITIIPIIQTKPNLLTLALAVLLGVFGYIPLLFFYKALQKGRLGVIVPISRTSIIWTIVLAMIILHEFITIAQTLIIILIITGVVLLTKQPNTRLFTKYTLKHGAKEALLAAFLWSLWYVLYKFPINAMGPFPTVFCLELGVLIGAAIHFAYNNKEKIFNKETAQFIPIHSSLDTSKQEPFANIKKVLPELIGSSVAATVATVTLVLAIQKTPVSIVTAITGASPLVAIIYGHLHLHERFSKQEIVGASITIVSVIILSML